jgi:glycine oxidase
MVSRSSILLPDVGQVRNPRLCKALRLSLGLRGVAIHENTPVLGFISRGGTIQGVRTAAGEYPADRVVIAAGAWSAQLLKDSGLELPVSPVRGQMIQFQAPPAMLRHILLSQGHYLIPRRDGLVLAGSTVEYAGFDKTTTPEAAMSWCGGTALVPALSGCSLSGSGRVCDPDHRTENPLLASTRAFRVCM